MKYARSRKISVRLSSTYENSALKVGVRAWMLIVFTTPPIDFFRILTWVATGCVCIKKVTLWVDFIYHRDLNLTK